MKRKSVGVGQTVELNVRIEKNLPAVVPDALSFETGASKAQAEDPSLCIYEHHGVEFSSYSRGALPSFYEDLLLGKALPLTFATPAVHDVDTLTAIALFLHRDLATHPATASFVYTVDFVHRLGFPSLAHIEPRLAQFLSVLRCYVPDNGVTPRELSERLTTAVKWVREYIQDGMTPSLSGTNPRVRVIDVGSNGFVLAEANALWDGWLELYRLGFLRGLLTEVVDQDRRRVLAARKSLYVPFNLEMAGKLLNQMELAMGEPPDWKLSPDGLWLEGPSDGTLILIKHVMDVLVRV